MSLSDGQTLFPGTAQVFHRFDIREGIQRLRALISRLKNTEEGIVLVGNIGVTSHMGDILRKARIPSRIEPL
jgi:hypothetical protein